MQHKDSKFEDFKKKHITYFFEGLVNIFIFLPYFFSVGPLFRTLFAPWKNLTAKKTSRGFSLNDAYQRFMTNLVSRGIGFMMRSCMIFAFFFFEILYVLFIPLIVAIYFLVLPLLFMISMVTRTEEQKRLYLRDHFLKTHLLKEENRKIVESWFDNHYRRLYYKTLWWKLPNLFENPPLARDWAMGYTPTLDKYTQSLTSSAYQNHYHVVIGREKETAQLERALSRSEEANVVLVGEHGVGKHSIVSALAQRMFLGKTSTLLAYKRLLRLNMEKILSQTKDEIAREHFLEELFREAVESRNVILLIENFDQYVSWGDDARVDLSTPIEAYAKTRAIQIIGLTTPFMYEKYVYPNERISHIFTKINVQEVSEDAALSILLELHEAYEKRYYVIIPYETMVETVMKTDFFITHIPFPEKAMQLIDAACVYTAQTLRQRVVTPQIVDAVLSRRTHTPVTITDDLKKKLMVVEQEMKKQVIGQDDALTKLASAMRRSFLLLGKRKKPLASFLFLGPTGVGKTETAKSIARTFFGSEQSLLRFDMSLYQSQTDISQLIGSMETQNPGILTNTVREHPYGVLLLDEIEKAHRDLLNIFLTLLDEGYFTDGYGKKVDCKNLVVIATSNAGANYLFQQLQTQPSHPPSSQRFAYGDQSQAVPSVPQSQVVLPNSLSLNDHSTPLPQRYQQASSQSQQAQIPQQQKPHVSRSTVTPQPGQEVNVFETNQLISYLVENKHFSPEFLNRFDGVIAYKPLQGQTTIAIARKMLDSVIRDIYALHNVQVQVSDQTLQRIIQGNFNPAFGARNFERILRDNIEDTVAKMILSNQAKAGDVITL